MTRASPEHDLQRAVVKLLDRSLPRDAVYTALNPLPPKGPIHGARLKRLGLTAGIPDLVVIHHGFTLWIELKAPGGSLSEPQKAMHARLRAAHKYPNEAYSVSGNVVLCKTIDEVILALKSHRMLVVTVEAA